MSASAAESVGAGPALASPPALEVPGRAGEVAGASSLSGDTATSERPASRAGSKRSLTGRKRDASTGANRAAQPPNGDAEKVSQPEASMKQKKKKNGLLSFLCCGQPDTQDVSAQDIPKPVRTPAPAPNRADQPGVGAKSDAGEVKSAPDATTSPSDPTALGSQSEKQPSLDANPLPTLARDGADEQQAQTTPATNSKQPATGTMDKSPVGAASTGLPTTIVTTADDAESRPAVDTSPQVQIQPPTPVNPEAQINDRTPNQEVLDNEIEQSEARPSVPLTENEAQDVVQQQHESSAVGTIPPPPPPPLDSRLDGQNSSRDAQNSKVSLLPPLRPEHQGRKCLVLDLDETLVHSSFKVSDARDALCRSAHCD